MNSKTMSTNEDISISKLPFKIREAAKGFDDDGDGLLDADEIAHVIGDLTEKTKKNRLLQKVVAAFVVATFLLIGCIFGASVTAARLAQEISVDHKNGFAYVKGSSTDVMKTAQVLIQKTTSIGEMTGKELVDIQEIIFKGGDLRFVIKGHSRNAENDTVILLVEGGSITFDANGIVNATGYANILLLNAFPEVADLDARRLQSYEWEIGEMVVMHRFPTQYIYTFPTNDENKDKNDKGKYDKDKSETKEKNADKRQI